MNELTQLSDHNSGSCYIARLELLNQLPNRVPVPVVPLPQHQPHDGQDHGGSSQLLPVAPQVGNISLDQINQELIVQPEVELLLIHKLHQTHKCSINMHTSHIGERQHK